MGKHEEVCSQGVWKLTPASVPINNSSPTYSFNVTFNHVGKMVQPVRVIATMPGNPSSIPGTHAAGENRLL